MTTYRYEPSKVALAKADELARDALARDLATTTTPSAVTTSHYRQALASVLQYHSDVATVCRNNAMTKGGLPETVQMLFYLILPGEPDALADAVTALRDGRAGDTAESYAHHLRRFLAQRGFKIVEDKS